MPRCALDIDLALRPDGHLILAAAASVSAHGILSCLPLIVFIRNMTFSTTPVAILAVTDYTNVEGFQLNTTKATNTLLLGVPHSFTKIANHLLL